MTKNETHSTVERFEHSKKGQNRGYSAINIEGYSGQHVYQQLYSNR